MIYLKDKLSTNMCCAYHIIMHIIWAVIHTITRLRYGNGHDFSQNLITQPCYKKINFYFIDFNLKFSNNDRGQASVMFIDFLDSSKKNVFLLYSFYYSLHKGNLETVQHFETAVFTSIWSIWLEMYLDRSVRSRKKNLKSSTSNDKRIAGSCCWKDSNTFEIP